MNADEPIDVVSTDVTSIAEIAPDIAPEPIEVTDITLEPVPPAVEIAPEPAIRVVPDATGEDAEPEPAPSGATVKHPNPPWA